MIDYLENLSMSPNPDTEDGILEITYPELALGEQRLHFVQRCREFLRNAVINKLGPLSDEALMYIAEQRGFDFLEYAPCYQDRQCYESVLETAAKTWMNRTIRLALEEEVLLKAARKCASRTIEQFATQIKNETIREKVLAIASKLEKQAKK